MNRIFVLLVPIMAIFAGVIVLSGCVPEAATDTGGQTNNPPSDDTIDPIITADLIIEPDDFEDGTVLTDVSANVTLSTALDDNSIAELFEVTASIDEMELAPTGTQVFAHSNIGFFNDVRRLHMEFKTAVSTIQITFGSGSFSHTEIGVLQGFDAAGNMVAEYRTQPLVEDDGPEVMTISGAGVAWAVAYSEGTDSFGRLDHLVLNP